MAIPLTEQEVLGDTEALDRTSLVGARPDALDVVTTAAATATPALWTSLESTASAMRLAFRSADPATVEILILRMDRLVWTTVGTLPARTGAGTTSKFVDRDLDLEQRYCYRVRVHGATASAITFETCGTTTPFFVTEPEIDDVAPAIVTITHPEPGTLVVAWLDLRVGEREWSVSLFDGLAASPLHTRRVTDSRPEPSIRQASRWQDLDPAKLYCFQVTRRGRGSNRLCASPVAARTGADQRDPRPEVTPSIGPITAENGALRLAITNPQPGQVLEQVTASTLVRRTLAVDASGASTLTSADLTPGQTYCYRLLARTLWGSRYSDLQCATTTTALPGRPSNLRVTDLTATRVALDWDSASNADSYEVAYAGRRTSYQDDDGALGSTSSSITFTASSDGFGGYEGYSYCFKVRAKNQFGVSGWTSELCDVRFADDGLTWYPTFLTFDPPPTGETQVVYTRLVSPGGSPAARLVSVAVAGNGAIPFTVRFLPPGSTRADCIDVTRGVSIAQGGTLTGGALATLYGAAEPAPPLMLIACKDWPPGDQGTLNDILIEVTYRR